MHIHNIITTQQFLRLKYGCLHRLRFVVLCFFLTKVSVFRGYFLLFVYFIGCRELTSNNFVTSYLYHILHFILPANLVAR